MSALGIDLTLGALIGLGESPDHLLAVTYGCRWCQWLAICASNSTLFLSLFKTEGIQFGVRPESIELAAVLSFPKSPWIMSNALVHKPKNFNSESRYC